MTEAQAAQTMDGMRSLLVVLDPDVLVGRVSGVVSSEGPGAGDDVAVLSYENSVLVGTVNQRTDSDTIIRFSADEARELAAALNLAAGEVEEATK